jgi:hypothetical protein
LLGKYPKQGMLSKISPPIYRVGETRPLLETKEDIEDGTSHIVQLLPRNYTPLQIFKGSQRIWQYLSPMVLQRYWIKETLFHYTIVTITSSCRQGKNLMNTRM